MKEADKSRIVHKLVVWTSTQKLKESVGENQIRNFPITIDDINRAEKIYEPHIHIIIGKSFIRRPEYHTTTPNIPLPHPI